MLRQQQATADWAEVRRGHSGSPPRSAAPCSGPSPRIRPPSGGDQAPIRGSQVPGDGGWP